MWSRFASELGLISLALGLVAGCGGAMSRAQHAFDEGRYPDAVGELRALETRSASFSPKARAKYVLMRGLTHLACGDTREATRWLGYAKSLYEREPNIFDDAERGRLFAAWRSMGIMPGEATPVTSGLPEPDRARSEPLHASRSVPQTSTDSDRPPPEPAPE